MTTTKALAAFSDALRELGIGPRGVEVILSVEDWQTLYCRLMDERDRLGLAPIDVASRAPITIGGVRYLVRFEAGGN